MDLAFVLSVIALICGVLMLVTGRWSKFPLAAIAIICLALVQSGLLGRISG
jgi:heme/copper-type cytochrome/quinol oxidase subunit 4